MENPVYYSWTKRVLLLACLAQAPAYAQDLAVAYTPPDAGQQTAQGNSRLLKHVLKDLEARFGIFFTYKSVALEDKMVQVEEGLLAGNASWKQVEPALVSLLAKQRLKYHRIDNIYVIYADDERINFRQLKRRTIQVGGGDSGNALAGIQPQLVFAGVGSVEQYPQAKDVTVTGRVTADTGEGLPGVNVLIKGSSVGTTTDAGGNYSLGVPDNNAVLVFSFIGYVSQEIPVGTRTTIDVSMTADVKSLNEVVVVGYGTQEKKDVTGAVGSVDVKSIQSVPITNSDQILQGRVAGVDVQANSGLPGQGVKINIRGVGSVNSTEPLYVIDGFYPGNINNINPNDIAAIDVLKDASASAIYGVLGANGVVIITTKRAKAGKPSITFDAYMGSQNPRRYLDMLGTRDFATVSNNAKDNALTDDNANAFLNGKPGNIAPIGSTRVPSLANLDALPRYGQEDATGFLQPAGPGQPEGQLIDTDWQRTIFRTAPIRSYNVGVSAGNENARISTSLGYLKQEGIVIGSEFDRISARVNGDVKFGRFTFGSNMYVARETRRNNVGAAYGATADVTKASPALAVYNPDPTYIGGFNGNERSRDGQDAGNPLRGLRMDDQQNRDHNLIGSIFGEYEILPGLTYKLNLGANLGLGNYKGYFPVYVASSYDRRDLATLNEYSGQNINTLIENTLNYARTFGQHKFSVLGGYVARQGRFSSFSADKNTFPVGDLIRVADAGANVTRYAGSEYENSQLGILGRLNYEFGNRYLLTVNVRRDGSSRFGAGYRYGTFPSASAGWRISEENFMKGILLVSDLKLRAGWGKIGNQDIGDYRFSPVINTNARYVFGPGDVISTGGTVSEAANDQIRWETTTQSNVGLDLGLLRNSITLTVDYFNKVTSDILLQAPIERSTGIDVPPTVNVGKIRNKGLEMALGYQGSSGGFEYGISGNMTFIRNEVLELTGARASIPGASDNSNSGGRFITRTEVGHPVGAFYGFVVEKLYQNNTELYYNNASDGNSASYYGSSALRPGDIKFKDLNGDGVINDKDKTYIGNPMPDFTYGVNARAAYKGVELQMLFQGAQGAEIYNAIRYWTEGMQRNFNYNTNTLNRFISEENPGNGLVPRANANDANNGQLSNRYIEDGSYLRLRNLTLAYNVGQGLRDRMGKLATLRVYATATNLLTFTKYTGFDPEVGAALNTEARQANLNRNVDVGTYPVAKSWIFGVQVGF
jgi:TonB-linked SusC/RagA family outer membrane protein